MKLQRLGTNSHWMHIKFTDCNISQIHKKSCNSIQWNILSLNVSIFLAKMFTPPALCIPRDSRADPVCAPSWRMILTPKNWEKTGKKPSFGAGKTQQTAAIFGFCRCFFTFQIKKSTSILLMKFPLDKTAGVFKQASASPNWCHSDFSRNSGVSKKAADFLCWKNSVGIRCFGSSCVGTFHTKSWGSWSDFFQCFSSFESKKNHQNGIQNGISESLVFFFPTL